MSAERDPLIGTVLADRYLIEEQIGEGGMGRVYRARHQRVGRQFAIKVLFGDVASHENMVSRFEREAAAAGRLNHRNVVSVVDFGEAEGGLLYLAMDFVDGENLRDVIKRERPLDARRIMLLLAQMCQGLAHAHGKGLVHRDFKTDNILVGKSDDGQSDDVEVARIVDFGIAMLSETANSSERLTTHGIVVGTPAYMSPEQAAGDSLDHRSDLFSLGLVLYEMLSGVLPFQGSAMGIMRSNLALEPPPICERVPGLQAHPGLEALAHELMAKEPDQRPQDANEVLARLEGMWTGRARLASASGISGGMSASIAGVSGLTTCDGDDSAAELIFQLPGSESTSPSSQPPASPSASQPEMSAAAIGAAATRPRSDARRGWVVPGVLLGLAVVIGVFLVTQKSSDGKRRSLAAGTGAQQVADEPAEDTREPSLVMASAPSEPVSGDVSAPSPGASRPSLAGQKSPHSEDDSATDNATDSATDSAVDQAPGPRAAGRTGKRRKRKSKRKRRPRETAPPGQKTVESGVSDQVEKAAEEVTNKALTSRYRKVGRALEALHKQRGEQVSNPLEKRYFAIPFADALMDPELRKQADASLRRLQRDIARALGE